MKLKVIIVAAVTGACLAVSIANAATSTLAKSLEWVAFGGTTNTNRPVCGISQTVNERYFGLKYFSGLQTFTIQMGGKEWELENGKKQNVTLRFDQKSPWNATGTGMHFNDGDAGLEYDIAGNELEKFMMEFRTSNELRIQFPSSDMDEWVLILAGTEAVNEEFQRCVRKLKGPRSQ